MVYSIIQKSQLEGVHRLDAEYYQPEYLGYSKRLASYPTVGELVEKILHPKEITRIYSAKGVLYLLAQNIRHNYIDWSGKFRIPEERASLIKQNLLKENDVVIVRSGVNYGDSSSYEKTEENVFASADVLVVRPKKISGAYLSTFLNTAQGQALLKRAGYGAAQPHIAPATIKEIHIPIFSDEFENEISRKISESRNLERQSESLYSQAENLLLEELGLKDFKPKDDLSYVVNLSEVKSVHRVDAEYFQPKYEKIISKIKSPKSKLLDLAQLSDIFSIRRGDFISPDYYVEKAKRGYIRIKELPAKGDINIDAITYIDDDFIGKNLETLQEGDFVFAGIGATLGKTARVPKELEESFYSNNTARFRVKKEWKEKVESYYLQVVFQSVICQLQFEQRQAQTAQAKIADEELKTVLIPVLPKSTQQKIADLVRRSHEARKKSKQLLAEAKRKVEQMIEKGEKHYD